MVPDDVAAFGREVFRVLAEALDGPLVGAYFVGSIALGGYVAGESDIDVIAVCERPVPAEARRALADAVLESAPVCPARGLEFTLYRRDVVRALPAGADFELNANGGPRMPVSIHLDPTVEPRFWYVIDRGIAHRAAVRIAGQPAEQVFADVPKSSLLVAMRESMGWHRQHEGPTLYSVLNACRAWRFGEEGALGSKLEGAAWARSRWPDPGLIDSAVALRHGRSAELGAPHVTQLLNYVEGVLTHAIQEE